MITKMGPMARAAVAAFSLILMSASLTGCSLNLAQRLGDAAKDKGRSEAQILLPMAPKVCTEAVPHADITVGMNKVAALARERGQLDTANKKRRDCGVRWNQLRDQIAAATASD